MKVLVKKELCTNESGHYEIQLNRTCGEYEADIKKILPDDSIIHSTMKAPLELQKDAALILIKQNLGLAII